MNLVEDPIPSLIRRIAIPASIGLFFNTMYNVVDTYFAGLISTEAQAALAWLVVLFFLLVVVDSPHKTNSTSRTTCARVRS